MSNKLSNYDRTIILREIMELERKSAAAQADLQAPTSQEVGGESSLQPAPAAAPDAQTPRTDALYSSIDGKLPSIQFGEMFAHARQLERENADLRRQLAEGQRSLENRMECEVCDRQLVRDDNCVCLTCWNKVNAELAAEQLRCKVAEERRDALSGELAAERADNEALREQNLAMNKTIVEDHPKELAAERAAREAAESKAQVMHYLHDALGVRWGDDPYARIDALKQAERDAALAQAVQEACADIALNCAREESEIPITGNPMYDVHYAYARGGNVMSRDIYKAIRSLRVDTMTPDPRVPSETDERVTDAFLAQISPDGDCRVDIVDAYRMARELLALRAQLAQVDPVAWMFHVRETGKGHGREFAAVDYSLQDGEELLSKKPLCYARPSSPEAHAQTEPHTDHPLRHWDRTCPACNPEARKAKGGAK